MNKITCDKNKYSGVPCIKGHRFPVAQLLAELADDRKLSEIADNFDLELPLLMEVLQELSGHLGQRCLNGKLELNFVNEAWGLGTISEKLPIPPDPHLKPGKTDPALLDNVPVHFSLMEGKK